MSEDNDQWIAQLRKGSLELCMLALLAHEERYGYQIAQSLLESDDLAVTEGTIYPLLSRMQREGLIRSVWKESPAGPPRKYYSLTPRGRETLEAKGQAWRDFSHAVSEILQEAGNGRRRG